MDCDNPQYIMMFSKIPKLIINQPSFISYITYVPILGWNPCEMTNQASTNQGFEQPISLAHLEGSLKLAKNLTGVLSPDHDLRDGS